MGFGIGGVGPTGPYVEGEVTYRNEYQRPPSVMIPFLPSRPVHVLQLKIAQADGTQNSVMFEGDLSGVVEIGDIIQVQGRIRGGNIDATSIYNVTTSSFVAKR